MHIANPTYDVAFKYMLEDNKVAKIMYLKATSYMGLPSNTCLKTTR